MDLREMRPFMDRPQPGSAQIVPQVPQSVLGPSAAGTETQAEQAKVTRN